MARRPPARGHRDGDAREHKTPGSDGQGALPYRRLAAHPGRSFGAGLSVVRRLPRAGQRAGLTLPCRQEPVPWNWPGVRLRPLGNFGENAAR